jgi:hypothetical protein
MPRFEGKGTRYGNSTRIKRMPRFEGSRNNYGNSTSTRIMSTPRFEGNRNNYSNSTRIMSTPRFSNNSAPPSMRNNNSIVPRRKTSFTTDQGILTGIPPGNERVTTSPYYPGLGLDALKNILRTTPKKYLKMVVGRHATSQRKANKILPGKKKGIVKYLQHIIRPKKKKSIVHVLV